VTSATGNQSRSGKAAICRLPVAIDLPGLMQLNPARYPFLLQSVASGPELARYDILFAFPGQTLTLSAGGELQGPHAAATRGFLGSLDSWWEAEAAPETVATDLPFTGGWFVYLGYELANEIEPGLHLDTSPALPVAFATRVPVAIVTDRHMGASWLVAESDLDERLKEINVDIASISASPESATGTAELYEPPADEFLAAVSLAKERIRAGDVFQVNLSRRWQGILGSSLDSVSLYRRLCRTNPAPFAGLVLRPGFALICSSPERLVKRQGDRIDTRPIAGTRPRNESPEMAVSKRQELLHNPKERAEHIMLIDLERNDLGRVCVGGSVTVSEFMVIESYSHVHHIVSNVCGIARPGLTPGELIRAVFPGGTITGCPKVKCMEIISQLEGRPRGAYTGSMGYLNRNGDCDLNILIRTISRYGDQIELSAGSGIVADSEPQAELEETRAKAKGLILALAADS
jgi:anthranilate synthase component 1